MAFKITTRGRYATRAIIDLAMHEEGKPVLLRELAQRQSVSEKYLERMMGMLVKAGLVRSYRGQNGGFGLARPSDRIRISDVIEAVEGRIQPVGCVADSCFCDREKLCATRDVWIEVEQALRRSLDSITLQNLVERQKRMERGRHAKQDSPCRKTPSTN